MRNNFFECVSGDLVKERIVIFENQVQVVFGWNNGLRSVDQFKVSIKQDMIDVHVIKIIPSLYFKLTAILSGLFEIEFGWGDGKSNGSGSGLL